MAGPLSGLGAQQQVQQYQQLQSGNNSQQVREREDRAQPQENTTQPREAEAAQIQNTDTEVQRETLSRDQVEEIAANSNERGTLVDISV